MTRSGCLLCAGYGSRHDPIAHDAEPTWTDEPCMCDTDFTCMADEHDKGRCDACETPGIYALCCGDHQARMCSSCVNANHGGDHGSPKNRCPVCGHSTAPLWFGEPGSGEHSEDDGSCIACGPELGRRCAQ